MIQEQFSVNGASVFSSILLEFTRFQEREQRAVYSCCFLLSAKLTLFFVEKGKQHGHCLSVNAFKPIFQIPVQELDLELIYNAM